MNNTDNISRDKECHDIIKLTNYYDILCIGKNATEEEIRKSYKKLAIKFHPDKNSSEFASDAFKKVSHSFTVLSNPEKKDRYDTFGSEEEIATSGYRGRNGDIDPFVKIILF